MTRFALAGAMLLAAFALLRPVAPGKPEPPKGPAMEPPSVLATAPVLVASRLGEIRRKFRALHPEGLDGDGAPGSPAEVDRLLGKLASDHARVAASYGVDGRDRVRGGDGGGH